MPHPETPAPSPPPAPAAPSPAPDSDEPDAAGSDGADSDGAAPRADNFLPFPSITKLEKVAQDFRRTAARAAHRAALAGDAAAATPAESLPADLKIKYLGTVKLHGSHSDIVLRPAPPGDADADGGDVLVLQSRNKVVTPGGKTDHAQMAGKLTPHAAALRRLAQAARERAGAPPGAVVQLAGEWCGPGVQKGVAICRLPHAFYLVGARVGGVWQPRSVVEGLRDHGALVFNIFDYPAFELEVHFGRGDEGVKEALDRAMELTMQVGARALRMLGRSGEGGQASEVDSAWLRPQVDAVCPVAQARGVTGPGEGIVWVPDLDCPANPAWLCSAPGLWFKTKGESHLAAAASAGPSAGPTAAAPPKNPLAGVAPEVAAGLAKLATRGRCLQAVEFQREMGGEGAAVCAAKAGSWVAQDVVKEEGLALEALGLKMPKDKGVVFKVVVPLAKETVEALLKEEAAAATPQP